MSHDYTETELSMMTPEERASVDLELNDEGPSQFIDDAEVATANAAKIEADAKAATDKAAQEAADKKVADDAAAAGTAGAGAAVVVSAPAPADAQDIPGAEPFVAVFRAPLVTEEQYAQSQSAIDKRFEDGELTVTQFHQESNALTQAKVKSDVAVQGRDQAEQQAWDYQQDLYFSQAGNSVLREDPRFWSMMQAQLQVLYADPAHKDKSNMQYLSDAGSEVKKLLGITGAQATAAPAPARTVGKPSEMSGVDIPKTLEGLPAAGANVDTGSAGEFAHMEKLDGMDYEFAYAKLSKEQQARFLAT